MIEELVITAVCAVGYFGGQSGMLAYLRSDPSHGRFKDDQWISLGLSFLWPVLFPFMVVAFLVTGVMLHLSKFAEP